jgi:hypothetical protein
LHGAADMAIEREIAEHTITLTGPEEELRRRDQQLLGAQLGEEAYFAAYQAGGRLSPAEAVAVALGTA